MFTPLQHSHRGFTLIELLVVIAIISILAAIALPNFLEAQTRAKVARTRADMNTIALGLEMTALDFGNYPDALVTGQLRMVTQVPRDPFPTRNPTTSIFTNETYRYFHFPTDSLLSPDVRQQAGQVSGGYAIFSVGPDADPINAPAGETSYGGLRIFRDYDPTNGTVSPGNIFRTKGNTAAFGTTPFFWQVP